MARQTSNRRPDGFEEAYRRPSKKSYHSPCGNHASVRPRLAESSSSVTIGATTSCVPKRNSSGTSYACGLFGSAQYIGSTSGMPSNAAR